ncbi:serine/threonine-protein kinase [Corynebacterium suedekumii]|uniref:non-specific serine/threonine protein kinase n=1 Tax=Corynebacterium suedekumii TaxID=3049801 RepID=A0ABY8VLT7_9CORY|nr:serine/threonine-protein kinase [Corynebacterium suedekumii]WIM69183.1 serine/threonine-protein kinase [Corynebacterium suedekumii]
MNSSDFRDTLTARHGYTDIVEIGRGGMGVVFRAWDPKLRRNVAVKQLSTELLDEESGRRRFESEMVTLGRISHSAVVKIHFADFTDTGDAYFVMDYIPGQDLGSLLRQRREWNLRFTVQETVDILRPVAAALDFLHLQMDPPIIHRDIKPGNILIPSGAAMEAKSLLTDFGISLSAEDTRITSLSMMIGTEKYYAPELFPGGVAGSEGVVHNQPTAATDNYALTLIAFEMLSLHSLQDTMSRDQWGQHQRPFPSFAELGLNPRDLGDAAGVEKVFRKALNPVPAYRYPTATAFIQELVKTGNRPSISNPPRPPSREEGSATTAVPVLAVAPPAQKAGLGPWAMTGLASIAVLLSGILGAGIWFAANHPAWEEAERPVVQAFPDLLPRFQELSGWNGLSCAPGEGEEGMSAVIDCHSGDTRVRAIDFGNRDNRDAFETDGQRVVWSNGTCEVHSVERDGGYLVVPQLNPARFALTVDGPEAEQLRFQLPVC